MASPIRIDTKKLAASGLPAHLQTLIVQMVNLANRPAIKGAPGRGIREIAADPETGALTIALSDGTAVQTGSLRGRSTYDLAVMLGYAGTLAEWIETQRGVNGEQLATAMAVARQDAVAAAQSPRYFDTIAAGRAAVTDGQTFGVLAAGTDGLTIYRRDSASAQTAIVDLASAAEVDGKIDRVPAVVIAGGDAALSIDDENDMRAFEVGLDGVTRAAVFEAATADVAEIRTGGVRTVTAPPGWCWAIHDDEGNVATGLGDDGVFRVRELQSTVPLVADPAPPEPFVPPAENRPEDSLQGIMHRGWSAVAPENTLPAYVACARAGRYVVECDIQWTSDGVAVLLHDSTIDRTSNGAGAIAGMTLAEARAFDFNNDRPGYSAVPIPTFREFMLLCKRLNLYAYCELKSAGWTAGQVAGVLQIIAETGMRGRVELDCFTQSTLALVTAADPTQRVGRLGTLSGTLIADCVALQTRQNVVAACVSAGSATEALVQQANAAGVPVVLWTVDSAASVPAYAAMGVSGIMTNSLNINQIIRDAEGI